LEASPEHAYSAQLASAAQAKLMPISIGVRRPKLDKEGLEKFLFLCFEREKHWHFKDLVVRCLLQAHALTLLHGDVHTCPCVLCFF
jgi:hypothetical protein